MKTYTFTYLDRKGNELTSKEIQAPGMLTAIQLRANILATTKMNDLWKIKIKPVN